MYICVKFGLYITTRLKWTVYAVIETRHKSHYSAVGKCRFGRLEHGNFQTYSGSRSRRADGEGGGSRRNIKATSGSSMHYSRNIPPLMEQNSSDFGNEEWETASESSDVLIYRDSKVEEDGGSKEVGVDSRKEVKKGFSSQRPCIDRPNRACGNGLEELSNGKNGIVSGRGGGSSNSRGLRQGPSSSHRDRADVAVMPDSPQASSSSQNKYDIYGFQALEGIQRQWLLTVLFSAQTF